MVRAWSAACPAFLVSLVGEKAGGCQRRQIGRPSDREKLWNNKPRANRYRRARRSFREVAAWLRGRHPEVKIIFVTVLNSVEAAVDEMRQGAFHYLTKPVKLRRLLETVEGAWAACQANAQVRVEDLVIDLRGGRATLEGEPAPLTALAVCRRDPRGTGV